MKLILALLAFPLVASAQTSTYNYQGEDFTTTDISQFTAPHRLPDDNLTYAYTTSEMLSGTITLGMPLAPDLINAPVTPLSVVFNAGNGASSNAPWSLASDSFDFSTNSNGQIVGYTFDLSSTVCCTDGPVCCSVTPTQWSANASSATGDTSSTTIWSTFNSVTTSAKNEIAGLWTDPPLSAPEIDPSQALGALTLLAGIAAVVRGRTSKR